MSDIELRRMELEAAERSELRQAAERKSVRNNELFKWFVMAVLGVVNPVINVAMNVMQSRAIDQVAERADAIKTIQSEKLSAIVGGVDANVKAWKAYQTKEPEDVDTAVKAVSEAERVIQATTPNN